jgi:hypothetical protein
LVKKPALGKGIDSIFQVTKPKSISRPLVSKTPAAPTKPQLPKFKTFEVKLSILLRSDQLEYLTKLEREIMSSRSPGNKRERITKNSIIRSMLDILKEIKFDKEEIADEKELLVRIKKAIKS